MGGRMCVMLPRNLTVPCQKTMWFSTVREGQTEVVVKVVEGERAQSEANHAVMEVRLGGLSARSVGVAKISVNMELDAKGELHVRVQDQETSLLAASTYVTPPEGRLSSQMIEEIIKSGQAAAEIDAAFLQQPAQPRPGLDDCGLQPIPEPITDGVA
eukprot:TRINITY_DN3261_c0_g1_i1.p1 TRINITY_DN3261_c0_g1~~TRINITY_DN3261_c0_g1_i1.p1  ORF type:complete len:157 (-),score=14.85 TRINITY_DN3261_c0_g1_i1:18-488(-)